MCQGTVFKGKLFPLIYTKDVIPFGLADMKTFHSKL